MSKSKPFSRPRRTGPLFRLLPGMPFLLIGTAFFLGAALTSPAQAQNDTQPFNPFQKDLENMEDAKRQLLQALHMFLLAIPQYEPPEVLPNGDIIIRRKRPGQSPFDQDKPFPFERDDDGAPQGGDQKT